MKRQTSNGEVVEEYLVPVKTYSHHVVEYDPWPEDPTADNPGPKLEPGPDTLSVLSHIGGNKPPIYVPDVVPPLTISPDEFDAPEGIPRLGGMAYNNEVKKFIASEGRHWYGDFSFTFTGAIGEEYVRLAALRLGIVKLFTIFE